MKLLLPLLVFGLMSSCALFRTKTYTEAEIKVESAKANAFFEKSFSAALDRYPEFQTYMGGKKDYDKWNDESEAMMEKERQVAEAELKELKSINFDALDEQTKLSYRLFKERKENELEDYEFRFHNYPVNQMFGRHAEMPGLLINMHAIADVSDAKAYISRVRQMNEQLQELSRALSKRRELGITAPKFVYPKAIDDSKNIITGRPFDSQARKDSPLLEDFKAKVTKLKISNNQRILLIKELENTLINSVAPGFTALIGTLMEIEKVAPIEGSMSLLPKGEKAYGRNLKRMTTTDYTPDVIHELGVKETARIHDEMREILKKLNFQGDLKAFFSHIKSSPQFTYPSNQKGKDQYLADTNRAIKRIQDALPKMFNTLPKATLIVKAVEPYREKSAGLAFYQGPSEDGKRPGIYYVNLYDMPAVTKYELEALAHHEALPGHHMQISIAKELEGLPRFRKHGSYTAYIEGWGLYAEYLPKDYGFYQDPYSDFGRLAMELWRAARLVVDTGLHSRGWTIEQSIRWLDDNTPSPHSENVRAIERYVVMPGQATAYKIGMLKILDLREKAQKKMGKKFDIRSFHDEILKNGALPLTILEENIAMWMRKN